MSQKKIFDTVQARETGALKSETCGLHTDRLGAELRRLECTTAIQSRAPRRPRSMEASVSGSLCRWKPRSMEASVDGSLGRWKPRSVEASVGGSLGGWKPRSMGASVDGSLGRWKPRSIDRGFHRPRLPSTEASIDRGFHRPRLRWPGLGLGSMKQQGRLASSAQHHQIDGLT